MNTSSAIQMSRDETIALLSENLGNVVRITFTSEARNPITPLRNIPMEDHLVNSRTQDMRVMNLDDEGFVNQIGGEDFWSTFEDVESVEVLA